MEPPNKTIMKNIKSLATRPEVKIAAAEFFIKYMSEMLYEEIADRSKEANETADILYKVEAYLEKLQSN